MPRRYEFAIDGDNDVFGQCPELWISSIREAKDSLNEMADDIEEWLDEDYKPKTTVELRRQDDQRVVAVFEPRARIERFPNGTVSMNVVWRRTE